MKRSAKPSRSRKTRRRSGGDGPDRAAAPFSRSPTALAVELLESGAMSADSGPATTVPGDDSVLVGDPDDDRLRNEYVGDETPGASSPTPDQNGVDDIGRAYGLQEGDTGGLRSAAEVLGRRDSRRYELKPPRGRTI